MTTSGIQLKVERAKEHIRHLDAAISTFCKSQPYTIGFKKHPQIDWTTLYVANAKAVPNSIALVTGDAVHNLRSSLDHLAWQLVKANGGKPDVRTYFPISETAEKYASALKKGAIKGVCVGAEKLIGDIQRYVTSDDTLWHIHELDRIDKHRLVITVGSSVGAWGVDTSAKQTVWFNNISLVSLVRGYEIVNIPTSTYSREKHENFKLHLTVAFGESEVIAGKPVLPTLQEMAKFVENLIPKFLPFLK